MSCKEFDMFKSGEKKRHELKPEAVQLKVSISSTCRNLDRRFLEVAKHCIPDSVGCSNHRMAGKKDLTFHMFPDREMKPEIGKRWIRPRNA